MRSHSELLQSSERIKLISDDALMHDYYIYSRFYNSDAHYLHIVTQEVNRRGLMKKIKEGKLAMVRLHNLNKR